MDRASFDPRYNPEYQRGFDPAVHEGPSAAPGSHEPTEFATAVVRIPEAPTAAPSESTAVVGGTSEPAGPPGAPADEGIAAAVPVAPWRNPYLVGLTVLGTLLIGGGISSFRWSVQQVFGGEVYEGGSSQAEIEEAMLAAQLAWGLGPLLALAGLLTLLGVLFFVAWRWRPRSPVPEEPLDGDEGGSQAG